MTLVDFLTLIRNAQQRPGIKPIVPFRPGNISHDRWGAMLRYYGTHYAKPANHKIGM